MLEEEFWFGTLYDYGRHFEEALWEFICIISDLIVAAKELKVQRYWRGWAFKCGQEWTEIGIDVNLQAMSFYEL